MVRAKIETEPYDSAEYLDTPEAIAAYLEEALAEKDPAFIAHAVGVAARAQGMASIAERTKLSRESLYRALSMDGNPQLSTLIKVLSEMGLRLAIEPDKQKSRATHR
jgi:probable addiction module antidote protein